MDKIAELSRLYKLKTAGVLTDHEFDFRKDQIITIGYTGDAPLEVSESSKSWKMAVILSFFGFALLLAALVFGGSLT